MRTKESATREASDGTILIGFARSIVGRGVKCRTRAKSIHAQRFPRIAWRAVAILLALLGRY